MPAPADLRLELISVPEGAAAELDLRFEAVAEGVLVTGSVTAPLAGECARCLAPVASSVTASFTELYLYPSGRPQGTGHARDGRRHQDRPDRYDEHEHEEQDDDERYLDGDLLDLEPALRDAVVLALPMAPLCRDDCPGLCVACGVPLADAGPGHGHDETPDPRWGGLSSLTTKQHQTNPGAPAPTT